jgi:hypothetical protein
MKSFLENAPKSVLLGILGLAGVWLAATVFVETSLGVPQTPEQWGHRAIGWGVEFFLVRTAWRGVRKCSAGLLHRAA